MASPACIWWYSGLAALELEIHTGMYLALAASLGALGSDGTPSSGQECSSSVEYMPMHITLQETQWIPLLSRNVLFYYRPLFYPDF